MSHPQSFLIVGYFDKPLKEHGTKQVTCFREEDRFRVAHIPTHEQLREYAKLKGYKPSDLRCEPVYEVIGDGINYTFCDICFPPCEVIDNRKGPLA